MRTAPLGRTGVRVTAVGFGGAPIAGLYRAVNEDTAAAAIDAAWQAGIRYFDTAPHYGLGLSERRLGGALATHHRSDYVLSTKVGRTLVPDPDGGDRRDDEGFDVVATQRRVWDFSADGVRRSLESSQERLGLDRVDVVLLHDPDDHWRQAVQEAYPVLDELRAHGVVGAIGAGMNQSQMLADLVRELDLDVVLVAGRYTLLDQSAGEVLLPLCVQRGVSVIVGGVFNSGLLARVDPQPDATFDYLPAAAGWLARARAIATVCSRHGVTLPHAAVAFSAGHPAVASVLLGMRTSDEVVEDVALATSPVPADLWRELAAEGLLPPETEAPVVV
jgi:D-threo-aldose 1-dehydrogenase